MTSRKVLIVLLLFIIVLIAGCRGGRDGRQTTTSTSQITTSTSQTTTSISQTTSQITTSTLVSPKYDITPGDYDFSLEHDGLTRNYRVHVPSSYNKGRAMPAIIILHGGSSNIDGIIKTTCQNGDLSSSTCMNSLADREGFIAVYPQATARIIAGKTLGNWNAGKCCAPASDNNIDDIGFISKMIEDLKAKINLDKNKIYAAGISNGGGMAYRLACELSSKIAAISSIAGGMMLDNCNPSRRMPVLHFHGTMDTVSKIDLQTIQSDLDSWAAKNGCGNAVSEDLPDKTNDETTVTKISYTGCSNGNDVVLYKINNGGHTWAGGWQYLSEGFVGKTSTDINANEEMWKFFEQHSI